MEQKQAINKSEEEHVDYKSWSLRRGVFAIIIIPGPLLALGYWYLSLLALLFLLKLYFTHSICIEYRSEGDWFHRYVIAMTSVNLIVGTLPHINSELKNPAIVLWAVAVFIAILVNKFCSKSDKDFKGLLRRKLKGSELKGAE